MMHAGFLTTVLIEASGVLIETLVGATLVLVVTAIIARLVSTRSAAFRHRTWACGLASITALPILALLLPSLGPVLLSEPGTESFQDRDPGPLAAPSGVRLTDQPTTPPSDSNGVEAPAAPRSTNEQPVRPIASADPPSGVALAADTPDAAYRPHLFTWAVVLFSLWFIGALAGAVTFVRKLGASFQIARGASVIFDSRAVRLSEKLCRAASVHRNVRLLSSPLTKVPFTEGIWRPAIVLPSLFRTWSSDRLRVVLAHEIAHIRRFDVGWQRVAHVARILYWYHPLVWYAERKMRIEREFACDDVVITTGERADEYAGHLVAVAASLLSSKPQPSVVSMATRSKVEDRVRALLSNRRNRTPVGRLTGRFLVSSMLVVTAGLCLLRPGDGRSEPVPLTEENNPDDGRLTLAADVETPNGAPADGAMVQLKTPNSEPPQSAVADRSGRVTLRGTFGNGAFVHAMTPDRAYQATWHCTGQDARLALVKPVTITLAPAIPHRVFVFSAGSPVDGATVAAEGVTYAVQSSTGSDGSAVLQLPAKSPLTGLVSWHPRLGIDGIRSLDESQSAETTLSLHPPAPLTVRVLDVAGTPVPEIELRFNVRLEDSDWIVARQIREAGVFTDEKGEAVVPWAPAGSLKYVEVNVNDPGWKVDSRDESTLSERRLTVHVRRKTSVTGRLVMPDGSSAKGLLITGFGFGPDNFGDIPFVRARDDGSFHFNAASDHGYVLGVSDRDWSSRHWAGLVLAHETATPATIDIEVRPSIPLSVRVTRGKSNNPVADAWVEVSHRKSFSWTNAAGENKGASGGVRSWFRTDEQGIANAGVGEGSVVVRLSVGEWFEERELEVSSDEPLEVVFHRPWQSERLALAQPTENGQSFAPSPDAIALAWTEKERYADVIHQATIGKAGKVEVAFDEDEVAVLLLDRGKGRCGFLRFGADEERKEMPVQPLATYSGVLRDEDDTPLVNREVKIITESFLEVVKPVRTDPEGRFSFTGIPTGVPLRLDVERRTAADPREYFLFPYERLFEPNESRQDDIVRPSRMRGDWAVTTKKPEAEPSFSEQVSRRCLDAKLNHLQTVVVLQGDDSANAGNITARLLSDDEDKTILHYLPLTMLAAQMERHRSFIRSNKWPEPGERQLSLVVLNDDGMARAAIKLETSEPSVAERRGRDFLRQHQVAGHDAIKTLASARATASASNRRIWLVYGGPRCGPCFGLARWLFKHRAVIEKDYVVVKLLGAIDAHIDEVLERLPRAELSIPWHAILESNGETLITSEGPTGNIGMPSTVEGIRHFRKMLESTRKTLSPEEIDALVKSLEKR